MTIIAPGIRFLDLRFQGSPQVVATAVLEGASRVALIDPGPTSTLPVLREQLALGGLGLGDVEAILLTHIHLDHAGAAAARSSASIRASRSSSTSAARRT